MNDLLQITRSGGVLEIVLNRSERRNAINNLIYVGLTEALEQANRDEAIRCVLITGAGTAFSAGNDLKEFISDPPVADDAPMFRFMAALSGNEKVVIAAVNGLAIGIGTTLLFHCDLVLSVPDAIFQLPFLNLAIVPEAASSLLLPRLVGHQRAMEMLLLGEAIDARSALAYGWVNRIVEPPELLPAAREWAEKIVQKPPEALRLIKRLTRSETSTVTARMAEENLLLMERLASAEGKEAISALVERRPPRFDRS